MGAQNLIPENINTGDILFFKGVDLESEVIEVATASNWSHVGMGVKFSKQLLCHFILLLHTLPENIADILECATQMHPSTTEYNDCSEDYKNIYSHWIAFTIGYLIIKNNIELKKIIAAESLNDDRARRCKLQTPRDNILKDGSSLDVYDLTRIENSKSQSLKSFQKISPKSPRSEISEKVVFLYECTTGNSPDAQCALTGNCNKGVKLTNFEKRANGYSENIGIRRIKIMDPLKSTYSFIDTANLNKCPSTHLDLDETFVERDGVRTLTVYYTILTNMFLNIGKNYETTYKELLEAWAFDCCGDTHVEGEREDGYLDSFLKVLCCGNAQAGRDLNYHPANEYDAFYCSELTMQCANDLSFCQILSTLDQEQQETPRSLDTKKDKMESILRVKLVPLCSTINDMIKTKNYNRLMNYCFENKFADKEHYFAQSKTGYYQSNNTWHQTYLDFQNLLLFQNDTFQNNFFLKGPKEKTNLFVFVAEITKQVIEMSSSSIVEANPQNNRKRKTQKFVIQDKYTIASSRTQVSPNFLQHKKNDKIFPFLPIQIYDSLLFVN